MLLDEPKIRLWWVRESNVSMVHMLFWTHSSWQSQYATWLSSRNRCFKDSHRTCNLFSASGTSQNATMVKSKSDISSGNRALRTHFLTPDKPKMRFWWSRKSDNSIGRMALKRLFLPLDTPKIRLWWDRERDVSSGGQALRTHFLPLDQP